MKRLLACLAVSVMLLAACGRSEEYSATRDVPTPSDGTLVNTEPFESPLGWCVEFEITNRSGFDVECSPSTTVHPTTTTVPATTPTTTTPGEFSRGDFPDETTTGYGETELTAYTGPMTITTANTVIDGKDIDGPLYVNAANVTIQNSWARNGIRVQSNGDNLLVQDTEIGEGTGYFDAGLGVLDWGLSPGWYTCLRCNVHHFGDAFAASEANIIDSYVHDLVQPPGGHSDGIQRYAPNYDRDDVIQGNAIECFVWQEGDVQDECGTSAVFFADDWEGTLLLDGNFMSGGGIAFRIHESGTATVTNNWVDHSNPTNNCYNTGFAEWSNNRTIDGEEFGPGDITPPCT